MLEKSKEATEGVNRAESDFLDDMSHELRTAMNGVIGMLDLLLRTDMNEKQRNFAQGALLSANNLVSLLNDILDLFKIEASKLSLEAIDFHIPTVIEQVVSMLAVDARMKGITLEAHFDENTISIVEGDPARLRQILANLVGIAIKFTERSIITIHLKQVDEQDDRVTLQFQVANASIGLPADASTTRRQGVTGIELTVARQLATLMNGEISVDSMKGKGPTFSFTAIFPKGSWDKLYQREKDIFAFAAAGEERTESHHFKGNGTDAGEDEHVWTGSRILVAEDDPVNQLVIVETVSQLGCQADVARTGKEAIMAMSDKSYDIVLMDCQMPEMDGYEATKIVREWEAGSNRPHVPIIAVTADARAGDRDRCLQAGMDDYLVKPFHSDKLRAILNRWLGERKTPYR